jgi:bacteriocin-like protein
MRTLVAPPPASPVVAAAPRIDDVAQGSGEELSDDELEHVVGGLTRPWDGFPTPPQQGVAIRAALP